MSTWNPTLDLQTLTALARRLRSLWRAPPRRARTPRGHAPDPVCEGPFVGWFDSSHDLLQGLAITEHGDDLVLL